MSFTSVIVKLPSSRDNAIPVDLRTWLETHVGPSQEHLYRGVGWQLLSIRGDRDKTIEFYTFAIADANLAMLFKLTWA